MEMYGKIKCVTYDELVPQVISVSYYRKLTNEAKLQFAQRGGNGRRALIIYDKLSSRIREKYDAAYPNAEQEMKEQLKDILASDMIRPDSAAARYFREYELPNGSRITDVLQDKYVLNAQVMNELICVEGTTRSLHSKLGFTHADVVWNVVLETCEKLHKTFGHTLPRSKDRLQRMMRQYRKDGYIALVSGKVGNQNTRKIGIKEGRLLLKLRRSKFPVYTEDQIFKEYNRRAVESGFNILKSENSVRNFLFEPSVMPLWYASVHGELAFWQKYVSQLKTEMPMMRDALWYSDGTKLNLYYKGYDENGKEKMCTTSVYEVMDAYSETFLGYDISPRENFHSQYRAFRMAIETAKVKPYEIVNDNQGGHKKLAAKGFFKRFCTMHRTTMPHHGQSKTIESAFGRFQSQILHKIWYFTGMNITANKQNSRPNMELIEANADKLPTLEEMKAIYAECRREWNESAHPASGMARMDMYHESDNPLTAPVTELDMIQMFWLPTDKPVTYTAQGIRFTLKNKKYEYEVYDADGHRDDAFALKNIDRKFHVMYDPQDMTLVELWEPVAGGMRLVAQATPRVSIKRSIQERKQEHEQTLWMREQLDKNKALRAAMVISLEDFDIAQGIAAEFNGLVTPKPKGISKKDMEQYREDYDKGRITAPTLSPYLDADPDADYEEPQTVGQWTKEVSNITFDMANTYNRF